MDRLADVCLVVAEGGPWLEWLAAAELQRYFALLCGTVPTLRADVPTDGPAVLVGAVALAEATRAGVAPPASEQALLVQTVTADDRRLLLVVGGTPVATQWAAYRLLEALGCGFYLGGDALSSVDPERRLPELPIVEEPRFAVRGTLPWYNFLNSPTTWNLSDHQRFYDQLAKQRANFVGFHSYDWEPWAAFPREENGTQVMKGGEPAATSAAVHRRDIWGVSPVPVDEYSFGTGRLFERGLFGADVALDWVTHDEGIQRAQAMLAEALGYARWRGIRTCVGFEVAGDPLNPANEEELRARLTHLTTIYPLDYLWLWQAENRGRVVLHDVGDQAERDRELAARFAYLGRPDRVAEGVRVARYFLLSHQLLKEVAPSVRLIVSGWGGDEWMHFTDFYLGLHELLPPDVIFAALDNIDPTMAPVVSAVYGQIARERECWPIPWFESDGGGTRRDQWGPQPNVHAFAPLLADAERKGCRGILGIHWRTRAIEEVAAFTFRRAWSPDLDPATFFADFARASYGPAAADAMARIHIRLEELGPRWTGAAGQIECARFSWFTTDQRTDRPRLLDRDDERPTPFRNRRLPDHGRLEELTRLEHEVAALARGASGSARERFDYLLAQMRWVAGYDRAALLLYSVGPLETALRRGEKALREVDRAAAHSAGEEALRILAECGLREAVQGLAEHVTNRGELGVLATINGKALVAFKALLRRAEALLDRPAREVLAPGTWPADPRITLPTACDTAFAGAALDVRAIVLAPEQPSTVEVFVRRLSSDQPAEVVALRWERGGANRAAVPLDKGAGGPREWWVRATFAAGHSVQTDRRSLTVVPLSAAPAMGGGGGLAAADYEQRRVRSHA